MDKRLFFLLNMAQRKLFNHVDKVCEQELDTPVTQLAALLYIVKHEGCVQKELAKAICLNKSAITGLIARMEKNDLVERIVDAEDARAIRLYPTSSGSQKSRDLLPYIEQLNNTFNDEFSEEEIQTVLKFLNFIIQRF
ncbi:MarR family winged helix-turn-helix transcriptional regulator [Marinomonas sp. PE14-40]|uniref:MarR family winged helix-turn-helix transcriptional regulator n=1 Tax=Marinomonas sp. PE14-40 TaxID=3060621 RepID=UPI003F67AFAB